MSSKACLSTYLNLTPHLHLPTFVIQPTPDDGAASDPFAGARGALDDEPTDMTETSEQVVEQQPERAEPNVAAAASAATGDTTETPHAASPPASSLESGAEKATTESATTAAVNVNASASANASEEEEEEEDNEPVAVPAVPRSVGEWLAQQGASAHAAAFEAAGFDNLAFLHLMERNDYAAVGVVDTQQQTQLAASLHNLDKVRDSSAMHTTKGEERGGGVWKKRTSDRREGGWEGKGEGREKVIQ